MWSCSAREHAGWAPNTPISVGMPTRSQKERIHLKTIAKETNQLGLVLLSDSRSLYRVKLEHHTFQKKRGSRQRQVRDGTQMDYLAERHLAQKEARGNSYLTPH